MCGDDRIDSLALLKFCSEAEVNPICVTRRRAPRNLSESSPSDVSGTLTGYSNPQDVRAHRRESRHPPVFTVFYTTYEFETAAASQFQHPPPAINRDADAHSVYSCKSDANDWGLHARVRTSNVTPESRITSWPRLGHWRCQFRSRLQSTRKAVGHSSCGRRFCHGMGSAIDPIYATVSTSSPRHGDGLRYTLQLVLQKLGTLWQS